jgi:hypothetical protein
LKKKPPIEREKEYFLNKKKKAYQEWDAIMEKLQKGETVSFSVIAQSMNECNTADYALMVKGLFR